MSAIPAAVEELKGRRKLLQADIDAIDLAITVLEASVPLSKANVKSSGTVVSMKSQGLEANKDYDAIEAALKSQGRMGTRQLAYYLNLFQGIVSQRVKQMALDGRIRKVSGKWALGNRSQARSA